MGYFLLLCIFFPFPLLILVSSAPLASHSIFPNFTASNFNFIDQSGAFLISQNNTFKASITNTIHNPSSYFFFLTHVDSNTVIWSANRNHPVSSSGKLTLTVAGISISDDSDKVVWSTPSLRSNVAAMVLLETGNLVLVDNANVSLWESFDFPTNTIVAGQRLKVGSLMYAARSDDDLSEGEYRILVTENDLLMQWNQLTFWKLSMDLKAHRDSNARVSFMAINGTGLYLFGGDGSTVVMQVFIGPSDFRFGRIGSDGRFRIGSYGRTFVEEFVGPAMDCQIPTVCGKLALCSAGTCSCPPSFIGDSQNKNGCVPADKSLSLPSACNGTDNGSELNSNLAYLKLSAGIDYFANSFMDPAKHGVNLSICQDLCSRNCSCLGIFYENSSSSCFLVQNKLGSIMSTSSSGRLGFVKTLQTFSLENLNGTSRKRRRLPLVALILIPSSSFFLIASVTLAVLWYRCKKGKLARLNSSSSAENEILSIAGLPIRYNWAEIVTATENFKTQIGNGGFGTVYKGTLPDKTAIAVKKITSLGARGKKDFCTEIAVIGNIHHVNLVKLKGFCVQERQRLLVLEYMNRGSLDHALFSNDIVLEWRERFQIALGTARGLAYLHSGCDQKIIHCDVKPENILLNENLQVKISDFGLSKLLSPEESGFFTNLRGTRGYLAPEWLMSSAISDKTDVYSFGMVLFEIVRGRRNCSFQTSNPSTGNDSGGGGGGETTSSSGEEIRAVYFPLLALEMHKKGRYLELADPRLEGKVKSEEVEMMIRISLCCVHEDPALRPSMANVVAMLEGGVGLCQPRMESLNFLHFWGRRFAEASTSENMADRDQSDLRLRVVIDSLSHISSDPLSGPR